MRTALKALAWGAALVCLPVLGDARAQCVFSGEALGRDPYAGRPGIRHVVWDRAENVARLVTDTAEVISVKHWTCDASGIEAKLIIHPASKDGPSSQRLLAAAAIVLDPADEQVLRKDVEARGIAGLQGRRDLPVAGNVAEFSYAVQRLGDLDIITLRHYRN